VRADVALERRRNLVPTDLEVVPLLQVHPELGGDAAGPREPERSVRRDRTLAEADRVDSVRRDLDGPRQP